MGIIVFLSEDLFERWWRWVTLCMLTVAMETVAIASIPMETVAIATSAVNTVCRMKESSEEQMIF